MASYMDIWDFCDGGDIAKWDWDKQRDRELNTHSEYYVKDDVN